MALPYDRKFNSGRQGELLLNEEFHKLYEALKHILDIPETKSGTPDAKLEGSIWWDRIENLLKTYDKTNDTWKVIGKEKFQITDQILSPIQPSDPVAGQLWLWNGVLCYYDGSNWSPVRAMVQDSQFNLAAFENFLLLCPLWKLGNNVSNGEVNEIIEKYREEFAKYMNNVLSYKTNSTVVGDGTKWDINHDCLEDNPDFPSLDDTIKSQFLLPNIEVDRVFINNTLNKDYEEVNQCTIQYPTQYLINKTPTLIHLNPGRLSSIEKKLIKIDRLNPKIDIPAGNSEFYAFRKGEIGGRLLLPTNAEHTNGDYEVMSDGIYLSYNACQSYDFILAIKYKFTTYKTNGHLYYCNTKEMNNIYFINNYLGPINVFVEGYNLEDSSYTTDSKAQTITMSEDTTSLELSVMTSVDREYGFIRAVDLKNRGIIKPLKKYHTPLYFVNGEALHSKFGDIEEDSESKLVYAMNAQLDMVWSVVELYNGKYDFNMFEEANLVTDTNADNSSYVIKYNPEHILDTDSVVLFIDGMLIKKEDIVFDRVNHTITVEGLAKGQQYILLNDRYNCLYKEEDIYPALTTGHKFSDSLVYLNGLLLSNSKSVFITADEDKLTGVRDEIKCFVSTGSTTGTYKIYNDEYKRWDLLDQATIDAIETFLFSYSNTIRAIEILVPYDKNNDRVDVYAYNLSSEIESVRVIKNEFIHDSDTVDCSNTPYISNIGALSVWLNGVRQYPQRTLNTKTLPGIREDLTGEKFYFPEPVTGLVTYMIEVPEDNNTMVCTQEVLDEENIYSNAVNVYKTENTLYPGRVVVFVNGLRQPSSSFSIIDNHTISFNCDTNLIGSNKNYPNDSVINNKNDKLDFVHSQADRILVEVRTDIRNENYFEVTDNTKFDIFVDDYGIDVSILESQDEILIYCNGMFWGAQDLTGYVKNPNNGTITITDSNILGGINADPLYLFFTINKDKHLQYIEEHGKEYEKSKANILLEWR